MDGCTYPQSASTTLLRFAVSTLIFLTLGSPQIMAQSVPIGSSTTTVTLQGDYPGSSIFVVPSAVTITSSGDGISGDASQDWNLTNTGSISGNTAGIRLDSATANGASVDNSGIITNYGTSSGGSSAGIVAINGGRIINEQAGTILSQSDGIYAGVAGTIVANKGAVYSNRTAVYFNAGGTFSQTPTGALYGATGIINNSGILNGFSAGQITGTGNNPALWYRGGSGTFTNSGVLTGGIGAYIQTDNTSFSNSGIVAGNLGTAISVTGDFDLVTLAGGSNLMGDAVSTGTGNILRLQGSGSSSSNLTGFSSLGLLSGSWTLAGTISTMDGGGGATVVQGGVLTLTGALSNSNGGFTTISSGGTLEIGSGGTSGSLTGDVINNGALRFNRSNALTFGGVISGTGTVDQNGFGTTTLSADNSYTGSTTISSGTLRVNGDQTAATGLTTVNPGGTLGGSGIIGGNVLVTNGGQLAPGNSPGTLTINGDLTLGIASVLNYELGQANTAGGPLNDLTNVGGNLTLAGILNVTTSAGGTFGPGVYRLFNYAGSLTNNGLALGTMPGGSTTFVQTSVDHQVNLVNTTSLTLNFWDGATGPKNDGVIQGGTGTWHITGADDNWAEMTGGVNAPFSNSALAVFEGTPGTVTVDDAPGAVSASGIQFAVDGYTVQGDAITLVGPQAPIRVGDGTPSGAAYSATIASALTGAGGIEKTDLGTLILTAANSYTGDTRITAGELQVAGGGQVNGTAGTFVDAGSLTITGAGSSFITPGDLLVGRGTGAAAVTVTDGGHLTTGRSFIGEGGTVTTATALTATVTGPGSVWDAGDGFFLGAASGSAPVTLTISNGGVMRALSAVSDSSIGVGGIASATVTDAHSQLVVGGSTTLTIGELAGGAGTLTIRNGGLVIAPAVLMGAFDASASGVLNIEGTSGAPGILQTPSLTKGAGSGTVNIDGGVLRGIGDNTAFISGFNPGDITIGAGGAFVDSNSFAVTASSVLSGAGALTKLGAGSLTLTADNGYTGATTVSAGGLYINGDQTAATGLTTVNSGATLGGSGIIGGDVVVVDGTIMPGTLAAPGTLTIAGSLTLSSGSSLNYLLGQADTAGGPLNDLLKVRGNLVLDGTLNVATSAGGSFGPGVYRLIDYTGALTDNGLTLGVSPGAGETTIQISIANQVNLVNTIAPSGQPNFWDGSSGVAADGTITGGDGVWQVGGPNTWTQADGAMNGAFANGIFAMFAATPGTVTVDNGPGAVSVSGMQFASDGYKVVGGAIELDAGDAIVRVGDGTPEGAVFKATIASELTGAGRLDKTDLGTLILTGTNTYTGGTDVSSGTLQLGDGGASGSIQGDVTVHGALAFNRSDMATFAGEIAGGGTVEQLGSGTTIFTSNSAAFTGRTEIQAGTLEVDGVLGGSADVLPGGRLTGTGQVGSTTNVGVIAPGRSGFGTLTVGGDYAGQGGGLEIKTQLGSDSSPTDRLIVTGATSGATPVKVTNVGGLGARTQAGILVVQVSGASTGQFTLANRAYTAGGQAAVVAGAYGYVLQKDSTDGDWYLRSSFPGAGGHSQSGSDAPLYQPGVPVYEAYANTLLSLSSLASLRERISNRQWNADDPDQHGVWGRVEGTASHLEPKTTTTGAHESIDSWKAQIGVDPVLSGSEDGSRLVGGVTAHVGTATTRLSSGYGGGDIDTRAFGVGATLTGYGERGTYVDAQIQATRFESDLSSNTVGREGDHEGYGYGVSVEGGHPVPLRSSLALTPQAQLTYASTSFNDFNDRFGARVESDKGDSLLGRLGLALDHQRSWQDISGQTQQLNLYGLVNLKHEFLDGTRVLVSGTPVDSRAGRDWGGFGFGGNYTWRGGRYSVYGQATADTDLSSFGNSYTVTATAGFSMRF